MVYPDELNQCIINVRSLRQEKATPRAEFMEEIQFLVLQKRKKRMPLLVHVHSINTNVTVLENTVLMSLLGHSQCQENTHTPRMCSLSVQICS